MTAFEKFEEQVFLNTVLIRNLTDNELGTGFLVRKSVSEDRSLFLLFSNKHVFLGKRLEGRNELKRISFNLPKSDGRGAVDIGNSIEFSGNLQTGMMGFSQHPDSEVDVACINISRFIDQHAGGVVAQTIDMDSFIDFEDSELFAGSVVRFVGYPSGFYDVVNRMPVLRTGHIASIPSLDFNGKPQVLIDAPVFPGSSGSPVFASLKGKMKLLGILSEAAHRQLDFLEIPVRNSNPDLSVEAASSVAKIPIQFLGLGILYKKDAIKAVYDMAPRAV